MITCERYHDFSAGHRVFGHEGKCANLHGHNYRIHFECQSECLDSIGRVIDFSVIKEKLCEWLEQNWDHKFLIFKEDELSNILKELDGTVVITDFNPTAENMALYLLNTIAPEVLKGTGVKVKKIRIEETRKCTATAIKE